MAERLVVLSDMYGSKRGLWITSYLGYLQQYFDIVFYDSKELANIELTVNSDENIYNAFLQGGMDTAVAHLLKKEHHESHYLTFCAGGSIAWKAGMMGLPMKSLYAISPLNLEVFDWKPECPVHVLYGEYGDFKKLLPSGGWSERVGVPVEIVPKFGYELYSDEKIIQKVCLSLLESMLKKRYQPLLGNRL
jgi:hypothetical protein